MLNENVGDLESKLANDDFIEYFNKCDLMCSTETDVDPEFENDCFQRLL